jgi:hypothetical protein
MRIDVSNVKKMGIVRNVAEKLTLILSMNNAIFAKERVIMQYHNAARNLDKC